MTNSGDFSSTRKELSTVESIHAVVSTVAYTCACDAAEHHPGYHLSDSIKDDLRLLSSVVAALNRTFCDLGVKENLDECFVSVMVGYPLPTNWAEQLTKLDFLSEEDGRKKTWINNNLLSRSLMETFILGLSLDVSDSRSMEIKHLYQWIAIARLVQLIIFHCYKSIDMTEGSIATSVTSNVPMTITSELTEGTNDTSIIPLESPQLGDVTGSLPTSLISFMYSTVSKYLTELLKDSHREFCCSPVLSATLIRKIGVEWLDFVGALAHVLHRCRPGIIPVFGSCLADDIAIEVDGANVDNATTEEMLWTSRVAAYDIDTDISSKDTKHVIDERVRCWIASLFDMPTFDCTESGGL